MATNNHKETDIFIEENDIKCKTSLETALKLTRYGKFHVFVVTVIGFSVLVNVAENMNGLLNSIGFLGILVTSHFWGFLADTWGRQKVLRTALAGSFFFGILSAFSPTTITLLILRFMVGSFISGVQAAAFSFVSEFHTKENMKKAVSIVATFMAATFIFLPLLAWLTIPLNLEFYIYDLKFLSWRLYLIGGSILNILIFILVCYLPESPKFLLSMGKKNEALNVLRRMYASNTGHSKEDYPVKDLISESTGTNLTETKGLQNVLKLIWNQTWPIFMQPHVGKTLKMSFVIFLLFSIGHGTFMWFPDFLTQMQRYTDTKITLCKVVGHGVSHNKTYSSNECNFDNTNLLSFEIIFIIGLVFTTVSVLISWYIEKIGQNIYVYSSLLISAISSYALVSTNNFNIIVVLLITFLSCSLCASILSAISVSMFPTNIRAMATCAILMFGRVGAISGSNLIGFMLENYCDYIFYLYGSLLLASMAVYYLLVQELKNSPKENM